MTQFGTNILRNLKKYKVDVVSQNGWLPLTPFEVIQAYEGRIINQHPGPLDPGNVDFGGVGMYGKRVSAARLAYSWMTGEDHWTEATTHHVTERFDEGQIIRVENLAFEAPVRKMTRRQLHDNSNTLLEETASLTEALLPLEHKNVLETLKSFGKNGQFASYKRNKPLIPKGQEKIVRQAKEIAIELFSHT